MIYTITLNPAIDNIIETSGFKKGETNYYNNEYSLIGGKGINVSIVLNNLGSKIFTTGLMGKNNSYEFESKFNELEIENNFIYYPGATRVNYKIKNLLISEETEINGKGIKIEKRYLDNLIDNLKSSIKKNDIVVVCGSVPQGVETDIYYKIGLICNEKGAIFILDSSKEQMNKALKSHPYLIKPNIEEICEILNIEYEQKQYSLDEIKKMIEQLKKEGATNVLLSMGSEGSLFFPEGEEIYKTGIAKGKLVNSVGSGDSMVAGFVYGISQNMDITKTLKYASASGSATAFSKWLGTKEQIESLVDSIKVERLQ